MTSNRADTAQPAFSQQRSSYSFGGGSGGGGSFNPLMLIPFVLLMICRMRKGVKES